MQEILGYVASGMLLISFMMKRMLYLRLLNTVGCLLFIWYAVLIDARPVIVTNAAIVLVNLYYLIFRRETVAS